MENCIVQLILLWQSKEAIEELEGTPTVIWADRDCVMSSLIVLRTILICELWPLSQVTFDLSIQKY